MRVHKGEVYPAAWPAILDHDTQVAVVAILDARGRELRHRGRTLLAGLLACGAPGSATVAGVEGICGHVMRGAPLKGKGGVRQPGYRCDGSDGGCGRLHRLAKPIDDFVTEAVIAALTGPGLTASIERRRAAGPALDPAMLAARLASDKRKLAALDLLRDDLADYETRVASVEARMAEARGALAASATSATLAGLPGTQAALERAWSGWGTDRRRDVIAAVVERVIVQPVGRGARFDGTKHLDIRWKA